MGLRAPPTDSPLSAAMAEGGCVAPVDALALRRPTGEPTTSSTGRRGGHRGLGHREPPFHEGEADDGAGAPVFPAMGW